MALSTLVLLALAVPQEAVPAAVRPADTPDELILLSAPPTSLAAFQLGDGGLGTEPRGEFRAEPGRCTTPGGIEVNAQRQGVHLQFPTGTRLLFAPDGHLHLRSGERAGPFPAGAELHLGCGSRVRIVRSNSRRNPIQDVTVVTGTRSVRLWQRNRAVLDDQASTSFDGLHLLCCGQGGAVYRAVGVGPIIVLDRQLIARDQQARWPAQRIAVLVDPLVQSLRLLPEKIGKIDEGVALAVALAEQAGQDAEKVFATDAPYPPRVERGEARFALRGGFELRFDPRGISAIRMSLHRGTDQDPFVEWSLGYLSTLHLLDPDRRSASGNRYWRQGVTVENATGEFRAREARFEVEQVRRTLLGLLR